MIGLHIKKISIIQEKYRAQVTNLQRNALRKLNLISRIGKNIDEINYLDDVIDYFTQNDFLFKLPSELETIKNTVLQVPLITVYNNRTKRNEQKKSPIKDEILKALDYKGLRKSFFPQYFQKIGIKACVYCNSQLTITAVKKRGEVVAKFDVDHFHSKDKFPFLSISLFNLYPACTSCNRSKSNNEVKFDLYTLDTNATRVSLFGFKLDAHAKAKYLTTKDSSMLTFKFNEPTIAGSKTFQETFHIEEIYETQHDVIEELIVKSQIYNQSYIKRLRSDFSKLSLNNKLFERVLVGNYIEDKDLHKRPMAKFTQDIAKQLGLI